VSKRNKRYDVAFVFTAESDGSVITVAEVQAPRFDEWEMAQKGRKLAMERRLQIDVRVGDKWRAPIYTCHADGKIWRHGKKAGWRAATV